VLSPSTERNDVLVKLPEYQSIPSLQEILYIGIERVTTVYRRAGGGWESIEIDVGTARLQPASIGLGVALSVVCRGVPALSARERRFKCRGSSCW
jgi:Uma2 family endonuclease